MVASRHSFATAFGAPITAPVAVADGRVYVPCEDGYLYVLGPDGNAPLPETDLELWKIRSPLTGPLAGTEFDWYTNYGDFSGTNANDQGLEPPLRMRWARRLEGTVKHLPVCGGGRLYMHTAEGQIIAVEQDTGRLLVETVLARRLSFVHFAAVHRRQTDRAAGRHQAVSHALPGCGHRQTVVGSPVHGIAKLESSVSAGRA